MENPTRLLCSKKTVRKYVALIYVDCSINPTNCTTVSHLNFQQKHKEGDLKKHPRLKKPLLTGLFTWGRKIDKRLVYTNILKYTITANIYYGKGMHWKKKSTIVLKVRIVIGNTYYTQSRVITACTFNRYNRDAAMHELSINRIHLSAFYSV